MLMKLRKELRVLLPVTTAKVIDLKINKPKPFNLQWLLEACCYGERNKNGFTEAGITEILDGYVSI